MTTIILLDTDGTVTELDDTDPFVAAEVHVAPQSTVFSCSSPPGAPPEFPTFDGPLVGFTAEWAYRETPTVNVKAWALYGRSPIAGPVILTYDDRRPFDTEWLDRLAGDIPGLRLSAMRSIAARHGLTWPDGIPADEWLVI